MNIHRPFSRRSVLFSGLALSSLALVPGLGGCAGASPQQVISDIVAGVEQAQVVLSQIQKYVDAYVGLDPALKAKIETALNDTRSTLAAVVAVGNVATDISDARFQAALADFATAFAAVVALGTQIGIQVAGAANPAVKATPKSMLVPEPILLRMKRTAAAPAPRR